MRLSPCHDAGRAESAMKSADVIRSAQCRAGYYRRTEKLCNMAGIPLTTFNYKLKHGGWKDAELRRLNRILNFTDEECVELIRG